MGDPLSALLQMAIDWPVSSQEASRRNAMVAATGLAQRRLERIDAEAFLREHARRGGSPPRGSSPAWRDVRLVEPAERQSTAGVV